MKAWAILICLALTAPLVSGQGSASGGANACATAGDGVDADGDGMRDAWEKEYFGDLCQTADGDFDEDGLSNLQEFRKGTDPTDDDSPGQPDSGAGGNSGGSSGANGEPDGDPEKEPEPKDPDGEPTTRPDESDNETAPERKDDLGQTCGKADDKRACAAEYCRSHPDDSQCRQIYLEACRTGKIQCAALTDKCVSLVTSGAQNGALAVCKELLKTDEIRTNARFVTFDVDPTDRSIRNYAVSGTLLFTSMRYSDDEDFRIKHDGTRLRFISDDARLEIHDSATGAFWFRAEEEPFILQLPADATATLSTKGVAIDFGDHEGRLVGKQIHLEGQTITASGHVTFYTPASKTSDEKSVAFQATAAAKDLAKEQGRLGAEVQVKVTRPDVVAYDEVELNITHGAIISNATPLRVVVSAELDEGKTIVLDLERDMLAGPELDLKYFDLNDDGTETQIVFRMAESLADVMDPADDGGQPEYWIVEDEDGIHVMASVPHWSTHIIEIAAIGEFLTQPSVLIGVAAGVMGVGVASISMFWPRREEEFDA